MVCLPKLYLQLTDYYPTGNYSVGTIKMYKIVEFYTFCMLGNLLFQIASAISYTKLKI